LGKFNNEAYAVSGGTNGVGLTSVNALSSHFRLTSIRDGRQRYFECERGKLVTPLTVGRKTSATGTVVEFTPDPEVMEVTEFPPAAVVEMAKRAAYLNAGLRISVEDERGDGYREDFHYPEGVVTYVAELAAEAAGRKGRIITEDPISIRGEHEGVQVDIALSYGTQEGESITSFANGIVTKDGGTHVTGLKTALTRLVTRAVEEHSVVGKRESVKVEGEDTRDGLVAVVAVRVATPQFKNQIKTELSNPAAQTAVATLVGKQLREAFEADPRMAKAIATRAVAAAKGRLAAKRARESVRKEIMGNGDLSLPAKLKDCISRNPEECELFVVEGNSAGGSAEQGRDPRTQAVLKMRGKILNTLLKDGRTVMGNAEIQSVVASLGTGIGERCDVSALRYGKVVIMPDADVDGRHIATLFVTFFYRHARPILDAGRLYLARSPLYKVTRGPKLVCFLVDERAREEWTMGLVREKYDVPEGVALSDLDPDVVESATAGYDVNRIKGLGELDSEDLAATTMRPGGRNLVKIVIPEGTDEEDLENVFRVLMDERYVEDRKSFITENALEADIDA
jgi:DNA gyrase subunit B